MTGRPRARLRVVCGALVAVALAVTLSACASRPGAVATSTPTFEPNPTATSFPTPSVEPSPEATDDVQPEPVTTVVGSASVTIVNAGADGRVISGSGLVTGIVEEGGVCTLTATSITGRVLTGSMDAASTPAAVNCGLIDIEAPAGEWSLVLDYRSSTTSVASEPVTVTQP